MTRPQCLAPGWLCLCVPMSMSMSRTSHSLTHVLNLKFTKFPQQNISKLNFCPYNQICKMLSTFFLPCPRPQCNLTILLTVSIERTMCVCERERERKKMSEAKEKQIVSNVLISKMINGNAHSLRIFFCVLAACTVCA